MCVTSVDTQTTGLETYSGTHDGGTVYLSQNFMWTYVVVLILQYSLYCV